MKLIFKLTNKCGFDCPYCYLEDSINKGNIVKTNEFIDVDTCINSLKFVMNNYPNEPINISFFGGEPLVAWKQIKEWFDYLKISNQKAPITHSITTRGLHLTDSNKLDFLLSNKVAINISKDDISENEDVKVNQIIKKITNYEDDNNVQLLTVRVTITKTTSDLVEIYNNLKLLNVKSIHLVPITPVGAYNSFDYKKFINQFDKLIPLIENEITNEKTIRNAQIMSIIRNLAKNNIKEKFCTIGKNYLAINTTGDVYQCTGFLDVEDFSVGNVNNPETHLRILEQIENFEDKITNRTKQNCSHCFMKHLCAGNCAHEAFLVLNDYLKIYTPHCEFMRYLGDKSFGLYKLIQNQGLLNDIFLLEEKKIAKYKLDNSVFIKNEILYKPDNVGHILFELEQYHVELFDLIKEGYSFEEIITVLNTKYFGDTLTLTELQDVINNFIEIGVINEDFTM